MIEDLSAVNASLHLQEPSGSISCCARVEGLGLGALPARSCTCACLLEPQSGKHRSLGTSYWCLLFDSTMRLQAIMSQVATSRSRPSAAAKNG